MNPNTQGNTPNMSDGNLGYSTQTTQQEQMSQPERMTGNNQPSEINPNEHPKEYDNQDTRHQREIELPNQKQQSQEKREGYEETPDTNYIPEINGNEKYQPNYQDDEKPELVTE